MREARQQEAYQLSRALVAEVYVSTDEATPADPRSPTSKLRRAAVSVTLSLLAASRTDEPVLRTETARALGELGRLIDNCRQRGLLPGDVAASLARTHEAATSSWRQAAEA